MLRNLKAEMVRLNITESQIAQALGLTVDTLKKKLKGNVGFSLKQMFSVRDKFFPKHSLDYLFQATKE